MSAEEHINDVDQQRIFRAWGLVHKQYFTRVTITSTEQGEGMSIFHFLRKPASDGSNCEFYYAKRGTEMWNSFLKLSQEGETIEETYDHEKHVIICVQMPYGEQGDHLIGNIKIYDRETKNLVDTSSETPASSSS